MSAKNVWLGNEVWPSGRSPGDFAKDVFRLEGCKTDKEKALAFYKWIIRCMNRGPNLYLASGSGTYERCFDPVTLFTSWGSHECTGWGWIATEALCAAGLKARRVACHKMGHTIYEVWYRGDDGVEGWHAFDPFAGWYFLNARGEVASCAELAADHLLVQQPLPGHALPCGHTWDRSHIGHRHMMADALDVIQRIRNERLCYELLVGQTFSNLWRPEQPERALVTYDDAPPGERGKTYPRGTHCTIDPYDHEGKLRYPEHEPFWKNYRWPSSTDPHALVRWHGCGSLRWIPLNYGLELAEWTANAKLERGRLMPTGVNRHMEVWYRFRLPYLVSYINIDATVEGAGYFGFCVSADNGQTLWPIITGSPRWFNVCNGKSEYLAGKPSVAGLKEFLLRIDMHTSVPQSFVCVSGLRIMVGYQHNMQIQPRLLPGDNQLYLEAGAMDEGERLVARWNYTLPAGEQESVVHLDSPGIARRTVHCPVRKPEEIVMRGVSLSLERRFPQEREER
ncbi:MAG: hypothetical protein ACUVWX_03255 [Kiritimatiellia bacterium]